MFSMACSTACRLVSAIFWPWASPVTNALRVPGLAFAQDFVLAKKRLIEGDDRSATLKKLGTKVADLRTQHYVNNGVPDFHQRMQELEAEQARVSALLREKPEVRKIATGKTFRQHWEDMNDEQRHAYLKSAGVQRPCFTRRRLVPRWHGPPDHRW